MSTDGNGINIFLDPYSCIIILVIPIYQIWIIVQDNIAQDYM